MLEVGRVPALSTADLATFWARYTDATGVEAAKVGEIQSRIIDIQDYLVELSDELAAKE
jgi:hypothetical protein